MTELAEAIRSIRIPSRMQRLPISPKGFPVPWFVHIDADGVPDFRVVKRGAVIDAARHNTCWLCGGTLGVFKTFVIGPMCGINRVSSEPPSHLECAEYAVAACPFLTRPRMRRNAIDLPDDHVEAAGLPLLHNPGLALTWTTKWFRLFNPRLANEGILVEIGAPQHVEFWHAGRIATPAEVQAAFAKGLPILRESAVAHDGAAGVAELERLIAERLPPLLAMAAENYANECAPDA